VKNDRVPPRLLVVVEVPAEVPSCVHPVPKPPWPSHVRLHAGLADGRRRSASGETRDFEVTRLSDAGYPPSCAAHGITRPKGLR
jgi:hypothetical protein